MCSIDVAAESPKLVDPVWGIASYLGTPVFLNGSPSGTLCFYDVEVRSEAFSDWEQTFVELLGNWVGSELPHLQSSTTQQSHYRTGALTRLTQLIAVAAYRSMRKRGVVTSVESNLSVHFSERSVSSGPLVAG